MKKLIVLAIALFSFALTSNAQLKVTDTNVLTFGNTTRYNTYMTTWAGWAHAWINKSNNKVFKMDLSSADPRIGTNTNKLVIYDTEGSSFLDLHCRTVYTYSDRNAKSNIRTIESASAITMALRPVSYNWKDQSEYEKYNIRSSRLSTPLELGFIAQELEEVIPSAVVIDAEGNRLVNYMAIIPVLTATIQELNARVEALENQLGM